AVGLVPQGLAFALVDPGVHFQGGEAERNGGEELGGGHLALPVVGRAVTHFGGAAGNGVEHFQRRNQLTGGVDLHAQAAIAHGVDALGQTLGGGAQARVVLRPGGDHLPLEGLRGCGGGLLSGGGGVVLATSQAQRGKQGGGGAEQMATIHDVSLDGRTLAGCFSNKWGRPVARRQGFLPYLRGSRRVRQRLASRLARAGSRLPTHESPRLQPRPADKNDVVRPTPAAAAVTQACRADSAFLSADRRPTVATSGGKNGVVRPCTSPMGCSGYSGSSLA